MSRAIKRRTLLLGGGIAAIALAAGGAAATRLFTFGGRSADADAEAYVKLLAEVHDDYVNGRVVEHDGWIMSQHELDTLGSREKSAAKPAAIG